MIVLIDTSVLSLALRRHSPSDDPVRVRFTHLLESEEDDATIPGIVLQEILSGVRHKPDFERLRTALAPFTLLEPIRTDYENAAQLVNHCRNRGVQITALDALIAALAIGRSIPLFTTDRDFAAIAAVTNLRLLA